MAPPMGALGAPMDSQGGGAYGFPRALPGPLVGRSPQEPTHVFPWEPWRDQGAPQEKKENYIFLWILLVFIGFSKKR